MTEYLKMEWEKILDKAVARDEISGIGLLFQKDGKEECWLGKGYADRKTQTAITKDTIFRLYSMTKPVTAVATMALIEEGTLDLKAPVGEYLHGFRHSRVWCDGHSEPVNRPVLVSDLLS